MQTIFIISIFSLVLTIASSIISGGMSSSQQVTKQDIKDTKTFFESIAKVVNNDVTMEYFHANPNNSTTPEHYINNLSEVKRLSSGRSANPATDAWGQVIKGSIITEYQWLMNDENKVSVPVTGFLFVSGGPDRIIQTVIPTTLTTVAQLNTVVVPTDAFGKPKNDDIVYNFDNRAIQTQLLDAMRARMNRIGIASLKELQVRMSDYRQLKLKQYQDAIAAGNEGDLTLLDTANDSGAPRFLTLDDSATGLDNRRKLGVDEDFGVLEDALGSGGHFDVTAEQATGNGTPLVITVLNDGTRPTPWGKVPSAFKFQIKVALTSS